MAGVTGNNDSAIAGGAMAGATIGEHIAEGSKAMIDNTFNNNVKVLVKDGDLSDKDIIKNTAQIGMKERWSEGKMVIVGQMAENFKDLANNEELQKQVRESLKEQGVGDDKISKAIDDIIEVQKTKKSEDKKILEKAQKNVKNWK